MRRRRLQTWFGLAVVLAGCGAGGVGEGGDDFGASADAGAGSPECFSASECPVGWTCSELGTCLPPPDPGPDGGTEQPPEVEYELGAPLSSERFVWVAMTDRDSIAKIDGDTLEVTAIPVGERPEVVATLPGTDAAIILDGINAATTVVQPAGATDATALAPTLPHLNALASSPDGHHAVAYFDLIKAISDAGGLDAVGEVGSFQDVTVIALDGTGRVQTVNLTVGFRPREIEFDASGAHAYVITDDGISVIDLAGVIAGGPTIVPPVPISADPFADPSALEVDVTSSGAFALVRASGQASVRIVPLTGPAIGAGLDVALPEAPSDLELAPDGRVAYAVLRASHELAVIPLDDPAAVELVELPDATLGSLTLTADGRRGVLFTNATLDERVTVIELAQPGRPHRTLPLQKSVRAVGVAPDGDTLLVIHARAPGDPGTATTFDAFIDRSAGYSTVDLATGFAKLQITPVDPGAFAFSPTTPRAYLLLDGGDAEGAVAAVQELALDSGVVRTIQLGSPPDSVGILPASGKVFVSQRHPLGRVTFLDSSTGGSRTLTGFDLNSHVID